uniref:TBC1 domain family member 12-like n=1 Tax=Sinocyclocheilus grahami TaxID=75366 RepID=A0A672RC10_SINGR
MQGMFSHTGTSQGEKGQLQSIQDHDVPESCDKTTTQPCGTKLPNGHGGHSAHKLTEWDDPNSSLPAGSYFNSEGDHVIANGELSAGSRGGALDAISSVLPPQDAAVDRTTSSEDYLNAQNAVFNDTRSCSEGDPSLDRNSSASLSTPKHSLRTFSSSTFLNTDSARLSRYDDETFSTSDRPDDSIFTDVSLKPRNTYEISRRQSAPDNIPGVLSVAVADLTLSQRKQGISEIFNRSLFSRKQREAHSAPGWKLFGKVPLRESPPKDSKIIQQEYEARASKSDQSPSLPTQGRRKNLEFEPLSTTALILEDRPASLPAKSEEEAQRHRQEYDEMVAEAKKRGILMSKLWYCVIADSADRESSLDLIKLDISRTFPPLFIFQKGGPYHDLLHSLLGAYTCYRPDVGYVQGMSFIAAVLILNLEEADAFIAFANLLNKPCQMAFFRVDHELMLKYFAAFEVFFEENLPRLFNHFKSYNLTPDLYLIDWIFTLYTKSLPLDVACRVWDVFCRDGEEFLFRTGLGILRLYEDVLLQMDFIHIAQFLTRLPEDTPSERLLSCIANTQMISSNRKWAQVFNALIKDKEMEKSISPTVKTS